MLYSNRYYIGLTIVSIIISIYKRFLFVDIYIYIDIVYIRMCIIIVIIISIIPVLLINIIVAYVCMFQTHVCIVIILIITMCIIIIEENTMLYLERYALNDDRYYCYWHYHD